MNGHTYLEHDLPYIDIGDTPGKLIVVEGTDGVGRSTQISLLRSWLEIEGFGVVETGWARSTLAGETINLAKEGIRLNNLTFSMLYATDFADRLENVIIPALRSGFVVLTDRYIYTAIARGIARRLDEGWLRSLFGFGLKPDLVFYLKIDVEHLIPRVLASGYMDYWEAGKDLHPFLDLHDSFKTYQTRLLREYARLAREFRFEIIDAHASVDDIQAQLRRRIGRLLRRPIEPEPPPVIPPVVARRRASARRAAATQD